jgi:hypothetical protein
MVPVATGGESMVRALTRVLAASFLLAGLIVAAGAAPNAMACSNPSSDHCYAEAEDDDIGTNNGAYAILDVGCMYAPSDVRLNDTLWDWTGSDYWVEVGGLEGLGYDGNDHNKVWYWADMRPNGGSYHEHYYGSIDQSTYLQVQVEWEGSSTWSVFGGNGFTLLGNSTSQPNNSGSAGFGTAGTEYTGTGIRDTGNISDIQYLDTNYNFHLWGSDGHQETFGPGHFVPGSYNNTVSTETWSGPC